MNRGAAFKHEDIDEIKEFLSSGDHQSLNFDKQKSVYGNKTNCA
jgi:hypothetical protein